VFSECKIPVSNQADEEWSNDRTNRRRAGGPADLLAIEVQADGHVGNISVVQGQDHPLLVKAAVDAVRKKEVFPPLLQNGQPVTSVAQLALHFELH